MRTDPRIATASCSHCRASIIHAVTSGGNRVRLDAVPADSGDVRLIYRRGDLVPQVRFVIPRECANYAAEEPFYTEHRCRVGLGEGEVAR